METIITVGILGRYIARVWLRLLMLCFGSFISIYLVLDMMDKMPQFLNAGLKFNDTVLFFACKLPEIIGQTAPFSFLMATILTLGTFSKNSEIIAMKSCGVSLIRIAMPMFFLVAVSSIILLINSEIFIPLGYAKADYIESVKVNKHKESAVFKKNNIWFRSDTMIVQAQLFDSAGKTLKGVVIWTLDDAMNPKSRIDAVSAKNQAGRWNLHQGAIKNFTEGHGFTIKNFEQMEISLNLKVDDLKVLDNNADNLSYEKLKEYAENLKKSGYQAHRYLTMMHTKLAAPFAAFVMVLIGIPFAMKNSRSGGMALGIAVSVGIGFAYFVVNAVFISYGRSGVMPPVFAAWGANILFAAGGLWLVMTVKNQ